MTNDLILGAVVVSLKQLSSCSALLPPALTPLITSAIYVFELVDGAQRVKKDARELTDRVAELVKHIINRSDGRGETGRDTYPDEELTEDVDHLISLIEGVGTFALNTAEKSFVQRAIRYMADKDAVQHYHRRVDHAIQRFNLGSIMRMRQAQTTHQNNWRKVADILAHVLTSPQQFSERVDKPESELEAQQYQRRSTRSLSDISDCLTDNVRDWEEQLEYTIEAAEKDLAEREQIHREKKAENKRVLRERRNNAANQEGEAMSKEIETEGEWREEDEMRSRIHREKESDWRAEDIEAEKEKSDIESKYEIAKGKAVASIQMLEQAIQRAMDSVDRVETVRERDYARSQWAKFKAQTDREMASVLEDQNARKAERQIERDSWQKDKEIRQTQRQEQRAVALARRVETRKKTDAEMARYRLQFEDESNRRRRKISCMEKYVEKLKSSRRRRR